MDQKKIGKFIAQLRTERNWTQTELGEKLGVSYKAVSKWENGICLPDASLYNDICKIFKITKDELFAGSRKEISYHDRTSFILLILCLVSISICLFIPPIISNETITMCIVGITLIITLGYFTLNMDKLINIDKQNKKIKVIKIVNYGIILLVPIFLLGASVFKDYIESEITAISIISLLIASGVFFYRFPYNRYIGLRLPWTVRDESTWIIAHQILGMISLPISILTLITTLYFRSEICLITGTLLWILIPSIISAVHFYRLFCK